jgi:hypothetical protein
MIEGIKVPSLEAMAFLNHCNAGMEVQVELLKQAVEAVDMFRVQGRIQILSALISELNGVDT